MEGKMILKQSLMFFKERVSNDFKWTELIQESSKAGCRGIGDGSP
jgi:hypothetical protein